MLQSYGKVSVPTPGTPVIATTNNTVPTATVPVNAVLIEAWPTNVGKVYIGNQGMNKTTGVGVIAILAIPTVNFIPSFSATLSFSTGGIDVSYVWLDADNAGDSVIVSAVLA
jgi:hypothetical protein